MVGCKPEIGNGHSVGTLWVGQQPTVAHCELNQVLIIADIYLTKLLKKYRRKFNQVKFAVLKFYEAVNTGQNGGLKTRILSKTWSLYRRFRSVTEPGPTCMSVLPFWSSESEERSSRLSDRWCWHFTWKHGNLITNLSFVVFVALWYGYTSPDKNLVAALDRIKAVFRIRIHLIRIRIQHFRLNTDPDPDPGFWWPKIEKYLHPKLLKKLFFHKGRPSYRRSIQPSKENIQHFKTWNVESGSTDLIEFGSNPDPEPDSKHW
jgi:hypothetical protein